MLVFHDDRIISTLDHCQHPEGGFGGGPLQMPHLATTYAAVSALVECGIEEAYQIINRFSSNFFNITERRCINFY